MRRASTVTAALLLVTALVTARESVPASLQALADTERAFARAAREKGARDAFVEFFADDAVVFAPDPVPGRERWRARKPRPFSSYELTWEPRLGDVAASGDLGWLTGPATQIDHDGPDRSPGYENYLSIWRMQPDGNWRVILDVGVGTPGPVPFAAGFHRADPGSRFTTRNSKAAATESLEAADRALNARLASSGSAKGYVDSLRAVSRLHRNEFMPVIGRDAIVAWFAAHPAAWAGTTSRAEASEAGDLGFTYGPYTLAGPTPEQGTYLRVWSRDASGRWIVTIDTTRPRQ